MNIEVNKRFSFGEFELDAGRRLLLKSGEPVNLNSKTFDLLLTLVENQGQVLTKNDLLDKVWENQFVEENNLTVHVAALRKALGETKNDHRFIVTVPGKGYRFVAELNEPTNGEIVVESRKFERIVIEETEAEEFSDLKTKPLSFAAPNAIRASFRFGAAFLLVGLVSVFGYWIYQRNTGKAPSLPFQNVAFSRLTSSGKVNGTAISSDGKYFVYAQAEPEGQSLWVRQVAESRAVQVMPADAVEYWGLTFSPDSTQVYCTVFTAKQADPKLIRIPALGGAVESLPNVSTSGISFSPDGRRFAYVVSSSGARATLLRTANADGTDDKLLTILKDPSYFVYPGPTVSWSPDGHSIACSAKIVDESGDHGAVISVDVATGEMSRLTTRRFPWIESVSWLPGGNGLIISANEDAASPMQIWHQPLAGEVRRISNDLNWFSWLGTVSDGNTIVAAQNTTSSSVWVASDANDIAGAKQIAREIGDYGEIGWTPNGKLIYRSSASGKQNLWSMNSDGTNQKQLTSDAMPDKGLAVSPDGSQTVFSSYQSGRYNLWLADADGHTRPLTNGPGEIYPRITPDGQSVIFQQGAGKAVSTLWKMRIQGGTAVQITKTHSTYPGLSRDGKLISYFYMDTTRSKKGEWRIGIVNVDDGSMLRSFTMPENIIGRVVRWTPDNSAIVYAKANGNVGNLWRQALDGSPPVQITNFNNETIADFAWSQDGASFAFTRSNQIRDLVLLTSGK